MRLLLCLRPLPVRKEFLLMERRPLDHESHRPTMPKNRLISGTGGLLTQSGEDVFRLFARDLEVEGVRA